MVMFFDPVDYNYNIARVKANLEKELTAINIIYPEECAILREENQKYFSQ